MAKFIFYTYWKAYLCILMLAVGLVPHAGHAQDSLAHSRRGGSTILQRAALPESAFETMEAINVRDVDLRNLFRGLAERYGLNLVVDNAIRRRVTLRLSGLSVVDAVLFLIEEYGLRLEQSGIILRIYQPPPPPPEEPEVAVKSGRLSVNLSGAPLRKVARQLSREGEVNVVVGRGVSGAVRGYLEKTPFEAGLRTLMRSNGFRVVEEGGLYTILQRAPSDSGGQQPFSTTRVHVRDGLISFDVRNASIKQVLQDMARQMNLELIMYQPPEGTITARAGELSLEEAFGYLLRGTGVTFRREGRPQDSLYVIGKKNAVGMATSKLIRLRHLRAEGIVEMLPKSLRQQVMLHVIKEQNGVVVTGPRNLISEVETFIREIDNPTPQILIEALVVDFNTDKLFELGFRFGRTGEEGDAEPHSTYTFDKDGYRWKGNGARLNQYLDVIKEQLSLISDGIRTIGSLPADFFLAIRALAREGIAEVRSRPQISTLSGHPARISVGTTQYYILRTTTVPGERPGGYYPIQSERFEKVEANVTLDIVPWVTASGEVTVEIKPEFSAPVGPLSPEVPPTINTRVLESTVRLRDGETIILGGLIQESRRVSYNKVPILGQIPLIGQLFRSRSHDTSTSELVIYLTPHVFYGGTDEGEEWEALRKELGLPPPEEEGISIGYTKLKK